jgi:hypothetical protein
MTYASTVLADSPRWYLRLGESSGTVAEDATANNLDGTYIGSPALGQTGLVAGDTSVLFDSVNDYVRVLDAVHPTAYTAEAIVKPSTTATQGIFWRTDSGEGGSCSHYIGILGGVFVLVFYDGAFKTVTGTTSVVAGTVYHVAATAINGGTGKLYVNGISEGTPAAVTTLWTGGDRYVIGKNSSAGAAGSPDWFEGIIDEVALYTSVLSSVQIAAHVTAMVDLVPTGTAAVTAAAATAAGLGTTPITRPPSYLALAGSVDYADLRTD